jgi:hypothetical protein
MLNLCNESITALNCRYNNYGGFSSTPVFSRKIIVLQPRLLHYITWGAQELCLLESPPIQASKVKFPQKLRLGPGQAAWAENPYNRMTSKVDSFLCITTILFYRV